MQLHWERQPTKHNNNNNKKSQPKETNFCTKNMKLMRLRDIAEQFLATYSSGLAYYKICMILFGFFCVYC